MKTKKSFISIYLNEIFTIPSKKINKLLHKLSIILLTFRNNILCFVYIIFYLTCFLIFT